MTVRFNVLNRFSGAVQFTAEIDCDAADERSLKLGLAVQWAVENGANLVGASLELANLAHVCLVGADLAGANLAGANLAHANLVSANLAGASLDRAILYGASLSHASLAGANLALANLAHANLGNQWIIQGGTRADGYQFILTNLIGDGVRVKAGCRDFSVDEAETHWRETRGDTPLGRETALIIAGMIEQAKARGLSFETIE